MSTTTISADQVRAALGDLDHHQELDGQVLVDDREGDVRLILAPAPDDDLDLPDWQRERHDRGVARAAAARLAKVGLTVDADQLASGYRVQVRRS